MKKTVVVLLVAVLINACSTIGRMFPDNSTDYQRAEALPELEIPPDLSRSILNSNMNIPDEGSRVYSGESIQELPPELPGIPSVNPEQDEEESTDEAQAQQEQAEEEDNQDQEE